ncbi:hypothetical protein [Nocardioides sp. B-3]|uniref:hypothetical protein n=1 Tax=Nocardioides sp. B-3 TaxID=2895565 RepID=UPI002152844C|nr:hypothetical protein [Nocardioides sp. B-3]UUZ60371.1 hypothetical protein LP418_05535 [Nocardioides sp. B-3]
MTELPRKGIARGARLAALPPGYAGRTAMGFGKRLGGAPRRWCSTRCSSAPPSSCSRRSASSRAER